jgi:plastocyanin
MKRRSLILSVALTLPLLQAGPAFAPNGHIVNVYDDGFFEDVKRIPVSYGATESPIFWIWCESAGGDCPAATDNPHNVREDSRLFHSGSPVADRATFERDFSAGTFHYYCDLHGSVSGGMDGVIRVDLLHGDAPLGRAFTVRWAGPVTETGSAFDARFRVDGGRWRTWKSDTRAFKGVFGRNGNPVRVRPDHNYDFQARSQKTAAAEHRRSGWSPILEVMT